MKHFLFLALLVPVPLIATPTYAADDAAPHARPDYRGHPYGAAYRTRYRSDAYRDGAAVYGWSYRGPAYSYGPGYGDCGVFHYWNGISCVDARDNPPSLQ